MNCTQDERQHHDRHRVVEHIKDSRDGNRFTKPAFGDLGNQVAEVSAVHDAPEDGGKTAGYTDLHSVFQESFVRFCLLQSNQTQQEDNQTVACIRQHHAEEEDEEWGQKRGRVDAVWSRQRVHLGDNLVRFYKFAVFQLDRRVVLFVRLSQGVVALVAVEQLLQHRCIVCHNPAGQRKDALGLEDVLAHLLVVDLHLDHVRTGL